MSNWSSNSSLAFLNSCASKKIKILITLKAASESLPAAFSFSKEFQMKTAKLNLSINQNQMTIIHEEASRKAKSLCHQLAMDDPSAIFRGLNKLSREDQKALGYLKAKADKWRDITKKNILKYLSL
jgi:hypothetical protein